MGGELFAWLDYLHLCLKRYIHRYGFRMVQASGTINQLYVSLDEARLLLQTPPSAPSGPAHLLDIEDIEDVEAALNDQGQALSALNTGPISLLRARFRLSMTEAAILMAAAAPGLSVDLSRLYAFAWADFAVKLPTVGFLCELLAVNSAGRLHLRRAFHEESPLIRGRLLTLRDTGAWGADSPVLHRGVVVPDAILSALRGQSATLPSSLALSCQLLAPEVAPPLGEVIVAQRARDEVERALDQALDARRPRLLLLGPPGVGRRTLIASLAAVDELGTLTVDLSRLPKQAEGFTRHLADAAREALLRGAVLILRGDELFEDRARADEALPLIGRIIEPYEGVAVFTSNTPIAGLRRVVSDLFEVGLTLPSAPALRGLWSKALREHGEAAEALAEPLATRFNVAPGTIHKAVDEASARRALLGGGLLTLQDVSGAVRQRLEHALSQVAEPYVTTLTWDDVVLPTEVLDTLKEILAHARHRERVFDEWGFRQKMSYGRGLACLFSGPPGTGKTMMAGIIAQDLGREIYRVDLSRVVSKWVGETEKNLARVFDEAERAQVILLFDEADSLFSSRTDVKGSNDRHANMEINYLLQRMESYDGMSLLTTNFAKSIDEAFKRRIKFKVDFPLPEHEERARLWRVMIPSAAWVSEDIHFSSLGKKYKLSGGNIKNAILRAAFYAAEEGIAINHELLERAAVAESREMGRLI
ncbi:ATP-binding protein [Myxococcota bacterium]|nr:ATP-binding protein [Myxococcota bacterium]MBU1900212.1 ATP-binding protein [Myxococcota bacterium]